jgi:hypothetical protein
MVQIVGQVVTQKTTERLCINFINVQGRQPAVRYQTTRTLPTISVRSLPNIPTVSSNNEEEEEVNEPLPVPFRRSLRNKRVFW